MRLRRSASLCLAASLLFPAAANAACTAADLTGSWQAYAMSVNGSGGATWTRCKLTINASGAIANTTCVSPFGSGPLTQGQATLTTPATCTFSAQFRIAGVLNRVLHGTVSRDKEVGQGVGTFPSGGLFIFNMTKL
jgi:hypothetical protein